MILLDTCAIIWDALNSDQLSQRAKAAIETADAHNALVISDISFWEVAMLMKKGRIRIGSTAANFLNLFIQSRNVSVQPISPEIAELSVNFSPEVNNDPADRILAATSVILNAQLLTADQNLLDSAVIDTIW